MLTDRNPAQPCCLVWKNPFFLMKVLFVFVFTSFHGTKKKKKKKAQTLMKLGFAAFVLTEYCCVIAVLLSGAWFLLDVQAWGAEMLEEVGGGDLCTLQLK